MNEYVDNIHSFAHSKFITVVASPRSLT